MHISIIFGHVSHTGFTSGHTQVAAVADRSGYRLVSREYDCTLVMVL